MAQKIKMSPLDPGDWYSSDLAALDPARVWEMPSRIMSMTTIDRRMFVTLDDGRTVDMTDAFSDNPPATTAN